MNIFDKYTHDLLLQLNLNHVQYLVVGGYAVNLYGYIRTTGDIDLWIKPENKENKINLLKALKALQVDANSLDALKNFDFSKPLVFSDGIEPYKIDFITVLSTVSFDEAWDNRNLVALDDLEIPFIHFDHLVLTKINTGRLKDKVDVEELQNIQKLRSKK
ncbi:MAG: hypothetical protein IPL22_11965 [Bacteroidetes bacterium]|nr:hypothetical protein [Bacteroidota bacterium]